MGKLEGAGGREEVGTVNGIQNEKRLFLEKIN